MIHLTKHTVAKLWNDETGAETLEYALIIGLITVGAIVVIKSVGTKALARWTAVNSGLTPGSVKKS